jgi:hypothetical protein
MAGFSTAETDAVLSFYFRSGVLPKYATLYIGLHTADPTDAGLTAAEVPATNGYARAAVVPSDVNFAAPATIGGKRTISNSANVAFGLPTGQWASLALITHASVWDSPTAGKMLFSGVLSVPRTIDAADNAPTFGPSTLVFTLD